MRTILEILKLSTEYLHTHGVVNSRREAEELIAGALGLTRISLYMELDRPLNECELTVCRSYIGRRAKGEPFQYILGEVDFMECTFQISPAVLIPRQETEILAHKIVQGLSKKVLQGKVLWDVCCGSGCWGISVKRAFPQLDVVLSDVSDEALKVARDNALRNHVEVSCIKGDLLTPFFSQKAHFIICNPPYVSEAEFSCLDREVRQFEPRLALVGGKTGLEFYERLAKTLPTVLEPGGEVWLEIGASQRASLENLFKSPLWKNSFVEKDWAGHDHFFFLEME